MPGGRPPKSLRGQTKGIAPAHLQKYYARNQEHDSETDDNDTDISSDIESENHCSINVEPYILRTTVAAADVTNELINTLRFNEQLESAQRALQLHLAEHKASHKTFSFVKFKCENRHQRDAVKTFGRYNVFHCSGCGHELLEALQHQCVEVTIADQVRFVSKLDVSWVIGANEAHFKCKTLNKIQTMLRLPLMSSASFARYIACFVACFVVKFSVVEC